MHDYPDDRIPYVHGRNVVPIRRYRTRYVNVRHEQLFKAEDEVRARIHEIDQQLVELSVERKRLLAEIATIHAELRPSFAGSRGRRRRTVSHEEPLPPIEKGATLIAGRELRAICLAFLRKARGPLTLRQLHVLLHRAGYAVASYVPVKALADALGHETHIGRTARVARGTYAAARSESEIDVGPDTLPDW